MPRLDLPIGVDGPIIDVRAWLGPELEEALRAAGQPVPPLVSVPGLLDTGALVLVGRDLRATCRFTYDGRRRRLQMSY